VDLSQDNWKPVPDPTVLSTQQVLRENYWLRELLQAKIESIVQRLDGMDKAIELLARRADRVPSEVDLKVDGLKDLHNERFESIDKQFASVTALSNQAASGSRESLALALQAQRDASYKSETAIKERIEQMDKQFNTAMSVRDATIQGISEANNLLGSRVIAIESRTAGQTQEKTTQQTDKGLQYTLLGLIGSIVFGIIGVVLGFILSK
jgi:hypothetical protein